MNQYRRGFRPALAIAVLMFALASDRRAVGQTASTTGDKTITLGLVSIVFQNEIEQHFRPLVEYVAQRLSAETEGRVVVASTALQMAKLLDEKKVDFYMESTYPTYLINKQGAAVLILRRWKGGVPEYRSLIFTKKDGGITRLEDLRGKMIAFEDPGSTSGYFLPKILLFRKGFKLTEKPGPEARVAANEIGYVFESADRTIIEFVLDNQVAAGAFSDDDYGTLDETRRAAVTILARSESLPRHLVSTRKDLDPAVKKRLTEILLSMHQDVEGRAILQQTDNTTKFDRLPGGEATARRKLIETFRPRGSK
jgi:phosphate/phosphite/phosphonate ABC transporter binding protein